MSGKDRMKQLDDRLTKTWADCDQATAEVDAFINTELLDGGDFIKRKVFDSGILMDRIARMSDHDKDIMCITYVMNYLGRMAQAARDEIP